MKRNFLMILLCLLTISLCMFCLAACDTDGKSDVSQSSGGYTNEDNTHESESNNNHEEDSNNNADDNNSDEDNSDDNNSDSGEKEHVHQWGEWKVTKQATCTSKGEETRVCELDSTHKETREVAVNPKAHKLVHHNEKAATCSEKGWKAYDECSLCHYSTKVEIPKDSNAHQFVHQKEQEANCSSAGWSAYDKCELCGYEKGKTNYPINRDKHTFGKDNICTGCKTKWVYTENLSYKLNSNKTAYSVSGMGTATGTAITIPYYYNNLPVTAIESSAFKNYTRITSVTLPDSVTTIETMAFYGCNSITSLNLGNGLQTIESSAFAVCRSLVNVTIPKSVKSIGSSVFSEIFGLKTVTFEDTSGWIVQQQSWTEKIDVDVSNATQNADNFTSKYKSYTWKKA